MLYEVITVAFDRGCHGPKHLLDDVDSIGMLQSGPSRPAVNERSVKLREADPRLGLVLSHPSDQAQRCGTGRLGLNHALAGQGVAITRCD